MSTLVTGATGGLGRNATDFLLAQGASVCATGRNCAVGEALAGQGARFVQADLVSASDAEIDHLFDDIDTVWHCAALSSPWGRLQDFVAANVTATERLAHTAARRGVRRFVHISTPSLYFDYRHRLGIAETFRPVRYVNHYASTKAQAEDTIRKVAASHPGTTFVLLRPRGIFGPHDRVLLPRLLRLLRERGGRIPLPRGGAACVDLTYVRNVVHAMHLATVCEGLRSGDVFNITNGEPTALSDVLDALFSRMQVPCRIVAVPYPLLAGAARLAEAWTAEDAREPLFTRYGIGALYYDMTLDITKAEQILGYHPVVPLARGIEATADWFRSHGNADGL
jgi:nucleoside-diphosphate-sugar epimerase